MSPYHDWYPSCTVYVGNLGRSASKHEIESAFNKYGPLRSVWVARNPPGFAFVEFDEPRDAEDAVRGLDGTRCCGTRIRVELSLGRNRRGGRRPRYSRSRSRSPRRKSIDRYHRSWSRSPSRSPCSRYTRSRSRSLRRRSIGRYRRSWSRSSSRSPYSRCSRSYSRGGSLTRSRSRYSRSRSESRDRRY